MWDETFYVNPSVGSDTLGANFIQKDPNSSFMRPIYFISRIMTLVEKGYSFIEEIILTLMFSLKKLYPYLLPKNFVVITIETIFPYVMQHTDSFATRIAKWIV